jgi:hypothetical protein
MHSVRENMLREGILITIVLTVLFHFRVMMTGFLLNRKFSGMRRVWVGFVRLFEVEPASLTP